MEANSLNLPLKAAKASSQGRRTSGRIRLLVPRPCPDTDQWASNRVSSRALFEEEEDKEESWIGLMASCRIGSSVTFTRDTWSIPSHMRCTVCYRIGS